MQQTNSKQKDERIEKIIEMVQSADEAEVGVIFHFIKAYMDSSKG